MAATKTSQANTQKNKDPEYLVLAGTMKII